jgi:hypothetical protein
MAAKPMSCFGPEDSAMRAFCWCAVWVSVLALWAAASPAGEQTAVKKPANKAAPGKKAKPAAA